MLYTSVTKTHESNVNDEATSYRSSDEVEQLHSSNTVCSCTKSTLEVTHAVIMSDNGARTALPGV